MENPTLEQAKKILKYKDEDDYVLSNLVRTDKDGEYDDNGDQLADYYQKCKKIIEQESK